jgi:hypothetical protein
MKWIDRYRTAFSWLEVSGFWAIIRTHTAQLFWSVVGLAFCATWVALSPIMALYGSFRPTRLFKFIHWVGDRVNSV